MTSISVTFPDFAVVCLPTVAVSCSWLLAVSQPQLNQAEATASSNVRKIIRDNLRCQLPESLGDCLWQAR